MDTTLMAGRSTRKLQPAPVVVEVVGGLGNQMFQYAAARALADRLGTSVSLDLRRFDSYRLRQPALHRWRIDAETMSTRAGRRYPRALLRAAGRLPSAMQHWLGCFREPSLAFDPAFETLRRPVHLTGYFQSERYFHAIRERLLHEFVPTEPLDPANAALAEHMRSHNSVSLHVRRGDYVSVPENQQIHGACSPAYYHRAIQAVQSTVGPATWFVFSDDLAWVREHIPVPAPVVYVEGNGERPEWDIHLMSHCQHNVCANSSFSWWGAWLNANPDKRVVAPAAWFATPRLDAHDLVPASWLRVAN